MRTPAESSDRTAYGNFLIREMNRSGLDPKKVAKNIGVHPSTLMQEWTKRQRDSNGNLGTQYQPRSEPRASKVGAAADLLGHGRLEAFALLGWIDSPERIPFRRERLVKLFRAAALGNAILDLEPRTGTGSIVDAIGKVGRWEGSWSYRRRGEKRRVRYEDRLALKPTRATKDAKLPSDLVAHLARHDATLTDRRINADGGATHVIKVPHLLRPRVAESDVHTQGPQSILVIGTHWSGDAKVAALISEAFGHAFARVSTATRLTHSGTNDIPFHAIAERLEMARLLFGDQLGVARHLVWSLNIDDAALMVPPDDSRPPYIVYLRPTDPLVAFSARRRKPEISESELRRARQAVDEMLDALPDQSRVQRIDARLPDRLSRRAIGRYDNPAREERESRSVTLQDQFWDHHVTQFTEIIAHQDLWHLTSERLHILERKALMDESSEKHHRVADLPALITHATLSAIR